MVDENRTHEAHRATISLEEVSQLILCRSPEERASDIPPDISHVEAHREPPCVQDGIPRPVPCKLFPTSPRAWGQPAVRACWMMIRSRSPARAGSFSIPSNSRWTFARTCASGPGSRARGETEELRICSRPLASQVRRVLATLPVLRYQNGTLVSNRSVPRHSRANSRRLSGVPHHFQKSDREKLL
ncbi:hypothetical protein ES703_123642 [subsurface metagenome]